MPGEGTNSSRLGGTKTGGGFSVAGLVFNPLKPKRESACIYKNIPQGASVARRKSGKCFSVNHLPPGFGGVNLPLPRATREAFPSLKLKFFTASPFPKEEKVVGRHAKRVTERADE